MFAVKTLKIVPLSFVLLYKESGELPHERIEFYCICFRLKCTIRVYTVPLFQMHSLPSMHHNLGCAALCGLCVILKEKKKE